MVLNQKHFAGAISKSVDGETPVEGWRVYKNYEVLTVGKGEEQESFIYAPSSDWIERPAARRWTRLEPPWDRDTQEVYSPLRVRGLFLEFATILEGDQITPEVVLDWAKNYGVLGRWGVYPTGDGEYFEGRTDQWEEFSHFYWLSNEANRCLRLYEAATNKDGGPIVEVLVRYGAKGETPEQLADDALLKAWEIVQKHLESECYPRLYRRKDDGTFVAGWGFWSLLGALYLQMMHLMTDEEQAPRRCLWCRRYIVDRPHRPPPLNAPKGTRGRYKTRADRLYCDNEDECKNAYNYDKRKKRNIKEK